MASEITDQLSSPPILLPGWQDASVHRLFVYGTLRHPPLLHALVGTAVEATSATLPGHRAAVLQNRSYPGLVVDADAEAVGSLVEVDDDGLAVLDRFEGPEYTRTAVTAHTADGPAEAEAYLLTGPSRSLVSRGVWSLDDFVTGAASAWVGGIQPGGHHPTT